MKNKITQKRKKEKRAPLYPKVESIAGSDTVLMATVVAIIAFGVVMVYSASAVYARHLYGSGTHFLIRQAIYATAGLALMFGASRIDYHRFRLATYPMLAVSVGLMVMVVAGFGHTVGGATRWIRIGPINVQPAEIAKIAVIFWIAYSLSKKRDNLRTFSIGFLPHVLMSGLLMLLCLAQPDFGSAVMIGLLTFLMLFAAGARAGYLLGAITLAVPAAYFLIASSPYRLARITAFMEPFKHRRGAGYQITESLVSFGSGGVTGVGLGDSRQKLHFLPEAHTDFIAAIVGEELGFVGMLVLCMVFGVVVYRGLLAAWNAFDDYGAYLALGVTLFVGVQAFTNLAVAMGMLPTKGLALPFVSYGGSSLLVNAFAVGVLLNVSRPRTLSASTPRPKQRSRKVRQKKKRLLFAGGAG